VFVSLENKTATEYTLRDYEEIDIALASLNESLRTVDSRTSLLRPVAPLLGSDLSTQFELLDAAIHASSGSRDFLAGLKPAVTLMERGGMVSAEDNSSTQSIEATGERAIELLEAGQERFLDAQIELNAAREILDGLELDNISSDTLLDIQELRDSIEDIEALNSLALQAPELLNTALGIDETQTYLILSQNNDELRPSGGYIGTWGWIRVRRGQVTDYAYFPTTEDTPSPPPASMAGEVNVPEWWIQFDQPVYAAWDGSWHTDFPATAELAAWYYNNGDNPLVPVDGVIAVDITAIEFLVDALGEVYVPEYDTTVATDNFRETVYQIRADRDVPQDHKLFLTALFSQVIGQWQQSESGTRSQINRALLRALDEKHLMIYSMDNLVQDALVDLDWAGSQNRAASDDYLMVADANLGNKSSSSVIRQVTYDAVIAADGSSENRISVLYDFPATAAQNDPAVQPEHYGNQLDYSTILQVLVPAASQLTGNNLAGGATSIPGESFTIFTGRVTVLFDGRNRVEFEYSQSDTVEELGDFNRYTLQLEEQPGAHGDITTVSVSLPPDAVVIAADPEPDATYELGRPVLEFNFQLVEDQQIEVIYSR
jgi:hypothetical protein